MKALGKTTVRLRQEAQFLLFEAYRRNQMADAHERSKPISRRWLGLGTASAYRPALDAGLMVFWNGKTPPRGCQGWLILTEKGVTALCDHAPAFAKILADMNARGYRQTPQNWKATLKHSRAGLIRWKPSLRNYAVTSPTNAERLPAS